MCYTGLLKRIIPFALTFAAGLFIASFFVSIALPERNWQGRRGFNMRQEFERLRIENQQLRDQLERERMQNDEWRRTRNDADFDFDAVPPVDSDQQQHHPPPPPKQPKQPRVIQ